MNPGGKRTGVRLRELASRWYDPAALERYIDPVLADLQAEYEDAVRRGRVWPSRWIWIRGHAAFFTAIVCYGGGQAMRMLHDLSADDRRALLRTAAWCAAIMAAGTLVLAAGPFLSFVDAVRPDAATLAIYLIPQALPLSIPLGLALGVMWAMGRHGVSVRSRVVVLLASAALSAASFGTLGWLAPSTNQAFRVAIFHQLASERANEFTLGEPPKGTNELTLGELRRVLRSGGNEPAGRLPDDIRNLALNYHRRWAIACAPFVLSSFALVVIGRGRRSAVLLAVAGFTAVFGYDILLGTAETVSWLPAIAVAWIPNAVFVAAAIAGAAVRSPRSTAANA